MDAKKEQQLREILAEMDRLHGVRESAGERPRDRGLKVALAGLMILLLLAILRLEQEIYHLLAAHLQ